LNPPPKAAIGAAQPSNTLLFAAGPDENNRELGHVDPAAKNDYITRYHCAIDNR